MYHSGLGMAAKLKQVFGDSASERGAARLYSIAAPLSAFTSCGSGLPRAVAGGIAVTLDTFNVTTQPYSGGKL